MWDPKPCQSNADLGRGSRSGWQGRHEILKMLLLWEIANITNIRVLTKTGEKLRSPHFRDVYLRCAHEWTFGFFYSSAWLYTPEVYIYKEGSRKYGKECEGELRVVTKNWEKFRGLKILGRSGWVGARPMLRGGSYSHTTTWYHITKCIVSAFWRFRCLPWVYSSWNF